MSAVNAYARPLARLLAPCLLLGLWAGGCGRPPMWRANIQSDDPDERVLAIKAVAEARDVASVPHLVDRLEDEDAAVRFFAILALRKITGEDFGYDYARPAAGRARAVALWRNYVRSDYRTMAASSGEGKARPPAVDGENKPREASR